MCHSSEDIWLRQHWGAHVANQKPELRVGGENWVWVQREGKCKTKRRCSRAAERSSCAILFCLWRRDIERRRNWKRLPVFLQSGQNLGNFVKIILEYCWVWPSFNNLEVAIKRKSCQQECIALSFIILFLLGFCKVRPKGLTSVFNNCETLYRPKISSKTTQLSYYVSLGHCSLELKIIWDSADQKIREDPLFHQVKQKKNLAEMDLRDSSGLRR